MRAPLSFLLASFLAGFPAFSFAEMGVRFTRAAGKAVYVTAGRHNLQLGVVAASPLVVMAACVSAAARTRGLVGNFGQFVGRPENGVVTAPTLALACCSAWYITESVSMPPCARRSRSSACW